jgi:DNA-binding beta-propeller fold protein YncE
VSPASVRPAGSGPLAVVGTSNLVSGRFAPGNYNPPTSIGEGSPSYDPTTGDVVLAATDIDELLLVNPANASIQKWINLSSAGQFLEAAVFDPYTNLTYASLWNSSGPAHIAAVNDTSGTVVGSYSLGGAQDLALTLGEGGRLLLAATIYGTGFAGGNGLDLFNVSSGSYLPNNTGLGGNAFDAPSQDVYVPGSNEVFVAIPEQSQVVAVNLTNLSNPVVAQTYSLSWPQALTYDSADNLVYAASGPYGTGGLLSINATSDAVVGNNSTFPSIGTMTYDRSNDTIAAISPNGTLFVLAGATGRLTSSNVVEALPDYTTFYTYSLLVGSATTMITGAAQGQLLVIDLPNGTIAYDVWAGGLLPTAPTFDPANGELYVADTGTGAPTAVVNSTTGRTTTFVYGASPFGAFYDPALSSAVLVRYYGLSVVNGTTEQIVQNVTTPGPGPGTPNTATYDANSGYVFDIDYNATLVLNGTSLAPVTSLPYWGTGLLAVPSLQRLYIFSGSTTVRVVNTTSLRIVTNVTLPGSCSAVMGAFDPYDQAVYVAEQVCASMSVLNTTTNAVTKTISMPDWQTSVVYDPAADGVIATTAAASVPDVVFLVSDRNNSLVQSLTVGTYPYGETYDPLTGWMMVANEDGNTLSAVSASIPLNATLAAIPAVGQVGSAAELLANVTGGRSPYSLSYAGLPPGCASANTSTLSCTPSGPGTFALTVRVTDARGNSTEANLSWVVAEPLVITSFAATPNPVTLGATTNFWVNTSGGYDGVTLVFVTLPAGCTDQNESPLPCTPSVAGVFPVEVQAVDGVGARSTANLSLTVTAVVVHGYVVTFEETGLPFGRAWSVDFNNSSIGTTSTEVTTVAVNGSYSYSVPAIPGFVPHTPSGRVDVSGAAQTVTVAFRPFLWNVSFSTTTLPTGAKWAVTFNGSQSSSMTTPITFQIGNGTYPYVVAPPSGFRAQPQYGNLSVAGATRTVVVTFSAVVVPPPTTYLITFAGSGLPAHTNWSVTLNGSQVYGTAAAPTFHEANGSFPYRVAAPSGYTVSPDAGTVNVSGRPVTVTLTFTQNSTVAPPTPAPGGSTVPNYDWVYAGIGLVVLAVVAVAAVLLRRRQSPPPGPSEPA